MLLIVPSSETKRRPLPTGPPIDFDQLSFPELTPTRRRVAQALVETSADLDAFERLGVGPTLAPEVARNIHLLELPAMPVLDLYTGPLHEGLDASGLSPAAMSRADRCLVITSALWGALRPSDRIAPYRVQLYVELIGMDRLDHVWRTELPDSLADAAGAEGVVVDFRSRPSQAAGRPAGIGHRTVSLRIDQGPPGARLGDVVVKRLRGQVAHHLLESGADPQDAPGLADVLADRWPVRLDAPDRNREPWTMTLALG